MRNIIYSRKYIEWCIKMVKKLYKKILVSATVITFILIAFIPATSAISFNKDIKELPEEKFKWFHVTVIDKDGEPVPDATVNLRWSYGQASSMVKWDGQVRFWYLTIKSDEEVTIRAKVDNEKVSIIHDEDVTGWVDVTLQFESSICKQKTTELSSLLQRIVEFFPALNNLITLK